MPRLFRFYRWKRYFRPWLYRRRTRLLGLSPYRIAKFVVPLSILAFVIAHRSLNGSTDQVAFISNSAPITASISVIDGDTVRSNGRHYRLVGFDAPEVGDHARCERERELAAAATERLRQLIASGAVLQRVACACRPGTEGTRSCNYGRLCGVLKISNRNVGQILISEGLAHAYICGAEHCPPRQSWCR